MTAKRSDNFATVVMLNQQKEGNAGLCAVDNIGKLIFFDDAAFP